MIDRLEIIEKKYDEIHIVLINGVTDGSKLTELLKESGKIEQTVLTFRSFKETRNEVVALKELVKKETDLELKDFLALELETVSQTVEELRKKLEILLLPKDPNDERNVIIEIKGAAGGDEGNIFAGDLFRMYSKYFETMNWKVEILNANPGSMGGFSALEFMVTGNLVYSHLKYESGTHRVQRVPETESQGRVHTSTATVLVMPEAEEIELNINWEDIRFDTFNSSGPGGQSVNTVKSAVRLTHIPSGIAVSSQEGKSQHENKDKAFRLLQARIYDRILTEKMEKEDATRKSLVGRGDRSEKNRTYNYPQNRITDHRINLTLNRLDAVMEGRLDLVINPLINEFQKRQLLGNKI